MKKYSILLFFLVTSALSAQDSLNFKRLVSFSPQYLFNYGIRIDYERKISPNKWLDVAPQIYLAEKKTQSSDESTGRSDFNLLAGAGLSLSVKNYARDDGKFGAYLGYGLVYNYFYTQYYEDVDSDIEEVNASIHKIGFDFTLGYQMIVYDVAVIDIYSGLGTRKGFIENGSYSNDKFNSFPIGFNLTGTILLLGIKIGILY